MSVHQLVCPPPMASDPPVSPPGKYVPPHRRRGDLSTSCHDDSWSNAQQPSEYGGGYSPQRGYGDGSDLQGGSRGGGYRGDSGPDWKGGNRHARWGDDRGNSRSDRPTRKSETGTGWDVRDSRRYYKEKEADVFFAKEEKSTGINFSSYENIPVDVSDSSVDRSSNVNIEPIKDFREAQGIHPLLEANVVRVNYIKPTPVQKHSIPVISQGRDLMACAQTGSGKTAAFLFPIITQMLNKGPPPSFTEYRSRQPAFPVALILSPTRELAMQIYEEARKFAFETGIRTVVLYGGNDVRTQCMELEKGCDICVATPGRLCDLIDRNRVNLKQIKYLVLDEADRMLDMGFHPQINTIVTAHQMPDYRTGRQTVMFSATFPAEIQNLASGFLHQYVFLSIGRVGSTNDFIKQHVVYADEDQKKQVLLKLVRDVPGKILVFVETKKRADMTERFLQESNLTAISIHGDRTQQEREEALRLFRQDRRQILVATDVAARGLDISNIAHVINYDLPTNIDDYVHRIGRTGRAGNKGMATSLVNEQNRMVLRHLLSMLSENRQEVPPWFHNLVLSCASSQSRGGASSRGGRPTRGGGRFASRDIRQDAVRSSQYGGSNDQGGAQWRRDQGGLDNSQRYRSAGGNGSRRGGRADPDMGDDGWN